MSHTRRPAKKLALSHETVRILSASTLVRVAGGNAGSGLRCPLTPDCPPSREVTCTCA